MIESEMMPCKTQNRIQVDIIKLFVRMAIFLLCSNYLVYNFFGVEKIKNYVRVLAILLIAISIFFKKASTVFINQKREMFLSTCILSIFIILVVIGNGFDSLNIAACFMLALFVQNAFVPMEVALLGIVILRYAGLLLLFSEQCSLNHCLVIPITVVPSIYNADSGTSMIDGSF